MTIYEIKTGYEKQADAINYAIKHLQNKGYVPQNTVKATKIAENSHRRYSVPLVKSANDKNATLTIDIYKNSNGKYNLKYFYN